MNSLREKLEQLLKGLFALKEQQGPFVPALKNPTVSGPTPTQLKTSSGISPLPSIGNEGGGGEIKVSKPPAPKKIEGALPPASKKDPVKVAEQLRNPRPKKVQTEILKIESNGQWSLHKATPMDATVPISPGAQQRQLARENALKVPVDAAKQGFHTHSPEQHALVHGLTLHNTRPIGRGQMGASFATSQAHPHEVVVKNASLHEDRGLRGHLRPLAIPGATFNSARREVLYHDLANKVFGMGKYVPTTAGFRFNGDDWSAQKRVPNASHIEFTSKKDKLGRTIATEIVNPTHAETLRQLNNSGELDKLAMMDHIMGHHDRHSGNFMFDDKGGLHLIDNGTAFDYGNQDAHHTPLYRRLTQRKKLHGKDGHDGSESFHPEAVKWLMNIDPHAAIETFVHHGHDDNSPAINGFLSRLFHLQDAIERGIKRKPDTILKMGRKSTHQQLGEFL